MANADIRSAVGAPAHTTPASLVQDAKPAPWCKVRTQHDRRAARKGFQKGASTKGVEIQCSIPVIYFRDSEVG
jgi:hypothetical protein